MDTAGALRVEVGAGLGARAGVGICTLGDYWHPDRDERTGIGLLIHRAKDLADAGAAQELAERFASLANALPEATGDLPRLVAPVPYTPLPAGDGDRPQLAELLAASLAAAGAGEYRPHLVVKRNPTPRLRHVDPERRAEVAASAGYRAREPVAGRHVVVVDDVVLTGATLEAVTACLHDAGAVSVTAAVAAHTRQR
ncbi:MAG: phosphoribosyltransferase family protein [Acidimicrobiaceae bacterium]|nr:phosphoribosyltransferase family protein [Acidimicrobiaceae bacterium]